MGSVVSFGVAISGTVSISIGEAGRSVTGVVLCARAVRLTLEDGIVENVSVFALMLADGDSLPLAPETAAMDVGGRTGPT